MPRQPLTLNRRLILFLLAVRTQLANLLPLRADNTCCPFLLLLLISPFQSSAVTFTNAVTISETNNTYDGQDIIVDGATLTIDGPHRFNSVLLTNGAGAHTFPLHDNEYSQTRLDRDKSFLR